MGYERTSCPYCGASTVGTYRKDAPSQQRTLVHCPKCRKTFTVIYGQGKVRTSR